MLVSSQLTICWRDGTKVGIALEDNPVADIYARCMKNLQHLDLYFSPRENPFDSVFKDDKKSRYTLVRLFSDQNINVDIDRLDEQDYLNYLHDIYFQNCNLGNQEQYLAWTHVHDCIHIQEVLNGTRDKGGSVVFNYRNLAGPLYRTFDRQWLEYARVSFEPGTVFLREQELGKNPLIYFKDGEPRDIDTMKRISKPWVNLIPTANLAIKKIEYQDAPADFLQWFDGPLREQWCQHWACQDWQPWEISAGIPIGHVSDLITLCDKFHQGDLPIRIIL
jgi:hypothetical protein